MGDRLATPDMGRKLCGYCAPLGGSWVPLHGGKGRWVLI